MNEHGNIIIYKDKNGNDNIEVKLQDNTVWLNQEQLVKLYNSSKSNISGSSSTIIILFSFINYVQFLSDVFAKTYY